MRKPVLLIFTNALILIAVFMLLAQSLLVVQRLAQAQEVRGQVEVQRQGHGDFQPLTQGMTVAVGDVVRTGNDGEAEFAWADRTRWRLMPKSTLTMRGASFNSTNHIESSRFRLDDGRVFVRVVKSLSPNSRFEVETPNAVADIHSSVSSVAVAGAETKVHVWKGNVRLTDNKGDNDTVKSGQQAKAANGAVMLLGPDPVANSEVPPDMLRPELEVSVTPGRGCKALLQGVTEVGDLVQINGDKVPVLGNGTFMKPISLTNGHNEWTVTSKDMHDGTTVVCRAIEFNKATGKAQNAACGVK